MEIEKKVQAILETFKEESCEERMEFLEKAVRWSVYVSLAEKNYGKSWESEYEH